MDLQSSALISLKLNFLKLKPILFQFVAIFCQFYKLLHCIASHGCLILLIVRNMADQVKFESEMSLSDLLKDLGKFIEAASRSSNKKKD